MLIIFVLIHVNKRDPFKGANNVNKGHPNKLFIVNKKSIYVNVTNHVSLLNRKNNNVMSCNGFM